MVNTLDGYMDESYLLLLFYLNSITIIIIIFVARDQIYTETHDVYKEKRYAIYLPRYTPQEWRQ